MSGSILGVVNDGGGIPQMGATVFLFDRFEKLQGRVTTDENGAFRFDNLAAGAYSVQVKLASFVPAMRRQILVNLGTNSLLTISMASFFSTIEVSYPGPSARTLMTDDWKWVLRTASATRPVLRLLPDIGTQTASARSSHIFSDTRGLVRVSAGDGGLVSSFGTESDLGTAFALATSVFGSGNLQVAGNIGFGGISGSPSAGFRTSFSREDGHGVSPEVSLTMRQLYMPGRVGAGLTSNISLPAMRTMTLSVDDSIQVNDDLRVDYGFSMDSVSFFDRLHYASPYVRARYAVSDKSTVEIAYASGVPHSDVMMDEAVNASLQSEINALALFPRVSLRGGRATVQRSANYEIGYRREEGTRTYRMAVFKESVKNAGLSAAGADELIQSGDLLPDLFTNGAVFNAGGYSSLGYMAAVTQRMGDSLEVSIIYSSGGALVGNDDDGVAVDASSIRSSIQRGQRRAVTSQVAATLPSTGTHIVGSYQWADRRAATPVHFYLTQRMRSEAGLNFYIRQPIPSGSPMFPVRMELTADLRNLLAQGYLPFNTSTGGKVTLMNTPRTVRGGLSFIF